MGKIGDTVTVRYVEQFVYYNPDTNHDYTEEELEKLTEEDVCWIRPVVYHDVDYEICAMAVIPEKLDSRYHVFDKYVLPSDKLIENMPGADIMYYAYNVADGNEDEMEEFISNYTENIMLDYDYESKQTWTEELDSYKNMFLILGCVLSFIIGIIGVINFLNVNITGITTRKREFAILQSIGMTGKQLKQMLVIEGLFYAGGSVMLAFVILLLSNSFLKTAVLKAFWFSTYHTTLAPVLCILPLFIFIGIVIPILIYKNMAKKSIVERLREVE